MEMMVSILIFADCLTNKTSSI